MINDNPKPAMRAFVLSADATPIPEKIPDFQFLLTVLCIHKIPSGPSGIDTARPVRIPFQSKLISIVTDKNRGNNYLYIQYPEFFKLCCNNWLFLGFVPQG
jgi:hypothetical protein